MTIILGIDPGSRITGYGVIRVANKKLQYLDSGCIRIKAESMDKRLQTIFAGINELMQTYKPTSGAIEQVFMHQNAGAALKLGQAKGAAMVSMSMHDIAVSEYSARQVKLSVVGYGAADKSQVQMMVCRLLGLEVSPQADAADALAIAICHANTQQSLSKLDGVKKTKAGRLQ